MILWSLFSVDKMILISLHAVFLILVVATQQEAVFFKIFIKCKAMKSLLLIGLNIFVIIFITSCSSKNDHYLKQALDFYGITVRNLKRFCNTIRVTNRRKMLPDF